MKLPDWLKWRHAKAQEPGSLTVELSVDFTAFTEAMARSARRVEDAMAPFSRAAHRMLERHARRHEVMLAGLEARYYASGRLIHRSPEQVDAMVRFILGTRFQMDLTAAEAGRVASAFIAGTIGAWSAA